MITNGEFQDALSDILDYLYDWEKQARIDFEFAALKQWDEDSARQMEDEGRPALVFDRTRPIIQSVAGAETTNRYEPKFLPRDADLTDVDVPFSESGNKVYKWIRDRGDFEHHESAAFQSALICGIGCTEMFMDYEYDSDGVVRIAKVPIWEMGWDPSSVDPNLLDARHVIRDRWIDEDEIISRFGRDLVSRVKALADVETSPGRARGFMSSLFSRTVDDPRNAYFNDRAHKYYDDKRRQIRIWEMMRKKRNYETRIMIPQFMGGGDQFVPRQNTKAALDELRGAIQTYNFDVQMKNDQAMAQFQLMQAAGPQMDPMTGMPMEMPMEPEIIPEEGPLDYVEDFPRTEIIRSYHSGHEVIKEEILGLRDFPYQFITAFEDYSDQSKRQFFGLMRPMRDPQRYANKFFSQAVHMFAANPKGAILYEDDLFDDSEEAKEEWAKATGMIKVPSGRLQTAKAKYEIIPPGPGMGGVEMLLSHAMQSVSAAAGISEQYTVGNTSDLRRTAASAVQSVKESNLVTISQPFDALRLYKKVQGRLVLGFVAEYVQERQLVRLLGPEESEFIPALKEGELQEQYEVITDEAPSSKNKQMEVFSKIMETSFMPQLLEAGVPIPPSIAKFFPFPADINAEFEGVLIQAKELMEMQAAVATMEAQMQLMQMQQAMMMAQQGMPPQGEQGMEGGPPPEEGPPPEGV
jgi:hypothetical protein